MKEYEKVLFIELDVPKKLTCIAPKFWDLNKARFFQIVLYFGVTLDLNNANKFWTLFGFTS